MSYIFRSWWQQEFFLVWIPLFTPASNLLLAHTEPIFGFKNSFRVKPLSSVDSQLFLAHSYLSWFIHEILLLKKHRSLMSCLFNLDQFFQIFICSGALSRVITYTTGRNAFISAYSSYNTTHQWASNNCLFATMKSETNQSKTDERQPLSDRTINSYDKDRHHQRQSSRLEWAEASWIRRLYIICWW